MLRCTGRVAGLVLLLALPGRAALAQGLSISGHLGQYSPTQAVYQVSRVGVAGPVGKYKLASGSSKGAAVTVWLGNRFGLTIGGGTLDTRMTFTGGQANDPTVDLEAADLRYGSFHATAITSDPRSILQPYFTAGVAVIQRGGEAFADRDDSRAVGFAIGAGLRVLVARVLLTGGIEVLDYSARYQVNSGPDRSFIQRDFHLKGGVEVPIFGR